MHETQYVFSQIPLLSLCLLPNPDPDDGDDHPLPLLPHCQQPDEYTGCFLDILILGFFNGRIFFVFRIQIGFIRFFSSKYAILLFSSADRAML